MFIPNLQLVHFLGATQINPIAMIPQIVYFKTLTARNLIIKIMLQSQILNELRVAS